MVDRAKHISTSFVERQNLTLRTGMRRFTRLTNRFSKKIQNHAAMVAIQFMHYITLLGYTRLCELPRRWLLA